MCSSFSFKPNANLRYIRRHKMPQINCIAMHALVVVRASVYSSHSDIRFSFRFFFLCFMFCWPCISIHLCNKKQLEVELTRDLMAHGVAREGK